MVQRVFRSGMTRIKRRMADLNQAEASRGKDDVRRLSERLPGLSDYHAQAQSVASTFRVYHMDYNERVGHPVHAASIELVVLLQLMFRELEPAKAVDLGSGFSSFVLRTLAQRSDRDVEIWSVDDSEEWMQKTRDYLTEMDRSAENLMTWDAFLGEEPSGFDLVLHDMGSMEFREETLRKVLELAKPGGAIILDDVHKPAYRAAAQKVLEEMGLEWFSLRDWTRDPLTRYCWLVFR